MICFFNSLNDLVSFRFSVYIFCFVSFLSLQILLRFVVFRFVSLCFVSFRCVSFLFRFSLYRDPFIGIELYATAGIYIIVRYWKHLQAMSIILILNTDIC